ncbi:MAG: hypothetical protein WBG42_14380 [Cryomorphaceae bacterium]
MSPFHADSFIDSISDPTNGGVQKKLALTYLGLDLLDLNKQLEEARSNENGESLGSKSSKEVEQQSYPWWKLW